MLTVQCMATGRRTTRQWLYLLHNLSRFSDSLDSRAVGQVPLMAIAETWPKPRWPKPKPSRNSFYRQVRCQNRSTNSLASTPH